MNQHNKKVNRVPSAADYLQSAPLQRSVVTALLEVEIIKDF